MEVGTLSNDIWDSNWRTSKVLQCIMAYEYDQVTEISISAVVGYKTDSISATLTTTAKTTLSWRFLGL